MIKLFKILLFSIIAISAFSEESSWKNDFRIVTEDYPPYNYLLDGKLIGEGTEVVNEIQKELGISSVEHEVLDWNIAYRLGLKKPLTLLYSISRTKKREELFNWIGPIAKGIPYFYKLESSKNINKNTIKNFEVCSIKDDYKANYLVEHGYKVVYVKKFGLCFEMLKRKRVSLILSSPNSFNYELKTKSIKRNFYKRLFPVPDLSKGIYLALSKKTPNEIVSLFQNAFSKIQKNGKLKIIKEKYLIKDEK